LELISSRDAPEDADFREVASWLGQLPDGSVVNTSFCYTAQLETLATKLGITLVAVLRHPFDLFVSIHEIARQRSERSARSEKKERGPEVVATWQPLVGKGLDDPGVLSYLREGFADEIAWLREWHGSGVPLLRFELLESDPSRALAGLATRLGPLDEDVIARAVAFCPTESLVRSSPVRGRRMPALPAGVWRERLSDDHIAILRERYSNDVARLGYELA
jgi:hypothetical protein